MEEGLYIRFQSVERNEVPISEIKFPDQSLNRARYSEAHWVLIPIFHNWGYGIIKVRDVPREISLPSGKTNTCRIEHAPEEENYSHCEVRAYKNGMRVNNNNKDKQLGLKFRENFRRKIEISKYPEMP
ncbi:MAG: hypothetical protein WAK96_12350 [Desulfobaccales bacterium]